MTTLLLRLFGRSKTGMPRFLTTLLVATLVVVTSVSAQAPSTGSNAFVEVEMRDGSGRTMQIPRESLAQRPKLAEPYKSPAYNSPAYKGPMGGYWWVIFVVLKVICILVYAASRKSKGQEVAKPEATTAAPPPPRPGPSAVDGDGSSKSPGDSSVRDPQEPRRT